MSNGIFAQPPPLLCPPAWSDVAQVGTVTRVPAAKVNADESSSSKEYGVTFNNGRSEYTFHVDDLILDPPPYNYEVRSNFCMSWKWVKRAALDQSVCGTMSLGTRKDRPIFPHPRPPLLP